MIPNYSSTVEQVKNSFPRAWDHCHHEGDPEAWDFILLVAQAIYEQDQRFGLNGKRGNPDDMSWDALNWIGDSDDPADVIDVVGAAGGPSPYVTWQETNTTGAFINPMSKGTYYNYTGEEVPPPQPTPPPSTGLKSYEELGGDSSGSKLGDLLFYDYTRAGHPPDAGMGIWFNRTIYDAMAGMSYEDSAAKHRAEWCPLLGIVPDSYNPFA